MEDALTDYISRELVTKPELLPIRKDTPLIESGVLDSLSLLKLVLYIEERFGIVVAAEDVTPDNFETVQTLCEHLRLRQQEQAAS